MQEGSLPKHNIIIHAILSLLLLSLLKVTSIFNLVVLHLSFNDNYNNLNVKLRSALIISHPLQFQNVN